MSFSRLAAASALLLVSPARAHYEVLTPPSIFANEDLMNKAPCGGAVVDLAKAKITDFHAGGDAIGTDSTHDMGTWLYRIATDNFAMGEWTQMHPAIATDGAGSFCAPSVAAPSEFVGKKAVIGIVNKAHDGFLYAVSHYLGIPARISFKSSIF